MPTYFQPIPPGPGLRRIENHGLELLGFERLDLAPGETHQGRVPADRETLLVALCGRARVEAGGRTFEAGGRASVFAGNPHSVYLPRGASYQLEALSTFQAALPSGPSSLDAEPYEIRPEQVGTGTWGTLNYARRYREILVQPDGRPAASLIVGETITPSGNWSTYPPHKHEADDGPERFHEEMYYFRVSSPEGFGLARHYSPERGYDTTHTVRDDSLLAIPHGYHTYAAAPGYQTYYLWFLAGAGRTQGVRLDPDVGWVQKTVGMV